MSYEAIKELALQLGYRDKLKLAQLLIQVARKEEEEQYVEKVQQEDEVIDVDYVSERLLKSRPSKQKSLENFIDAMFQFKGSISEEERGKIITQLQKKKILRLENSKVIYLV
ncbi:MAG TPA: hypothetical protein PLA93_11800 [Acinetobacter towneri]|uniref:hypothetical protein n=1 Tax=Acinetobacter TaxID=469 RepID=UPI0015D2F833|nr:MULTISPECIES: hypothetical protein [Acinetobacter]MDM1283183.1 hypothetical protein [Acinetobacter towneri]HRO79378.1 hypothetical protein [Acinetobacter towneri]